MVTTGTVLSIPPERSGTRARHHAGLLGGLGHLAYRRRWVILTAAVAVMVVAVLWGTSVFGLLVGGGFDDPTSPSSREATAAEAAFGRDGTDVTVVYSSPTLTVDSPQFQSAVTGVLGRLPKDKVVSTASYWSTNKAPQLVSADRHATYVVVQLAGSGMSARQDSYDAVKADLVAPGLTTLRGGNVPINEAVNSRVTADIGRAEGVSTPILIVLLVLVFGGLVAASLPLAIGGLAILGAFTALRIVAVFTDVSVYAINIVTMVGLGLAIDYGLFVVSRFREELSARGGGRDAVEDALVATMRTAGRTVLFSGLTVAVALSAMMFFDLTFLTSMGYGGVAAVVVDMVAALTVIPALLAVLGPRVNSLKVPMPWNRRTKVAATSWDDVTDHGAWHRLAMSVMKRPVAYVVVIAAALISLGLPFLGVKWGTPDARVLPASTEARLASEAMTTKFPASLTTAMDVVVTFRAPVADAATRTQLAGYVNELGAVQGVKAASVTGTKGDVARVALTYTADPVSPAGRALVGRVRDVPVPVGATSLVGGFTAANADTLAAIGRTLPWAALWIIGGMLVLLFMAFGSVVLPLKAVVMNILSLSASFGVVVLVFQDGHLSSLLGFTSVGTIEGTQPVLMFAIAFGLAMDYEVFLLSRIREEWDRTHDNTAAVAHGLQRSGRIITSAALLLIVVIGAFATSGVTFIKMIGVGVGLAVLIDATVVRALLVPATMRLLGQWNWYAPAPLARFWQRYGIRESVPAGPDGPALTTPADPAYATMEG